MVPGQSGRDRTCREALAWNERKTTARHPAFAKACCATAQLLRYLKLTGMPVGLLINFKVPMLKDGIKRLRI
jgi:hypothetical protein